MTLRDRVRCSLTAHPEPAAWRPPPPVPDPYFCPRCWTDYYDGIIAADELLRSIERPMRIFTSWGCPRCTMREWVDDVPMFPASEKLAALDDIRAHIAMWAGTTTTYEKESARDDF